MARRNGEGEISPIRQKHCSSSSYGVSSGSKSGRERALCVVAEEIYYTSREGYPALGMNAHLLAGTIPRSCLAGLFIFLVLDMCDTANPGCHASSIHPECFRRGLTMFRPHAQEC